MANIDNLIQELGKLTVIEAGELAKKLEKTWGLDLNALMNTPAAAVEVKEEGALVKVILTGFAEGKKIPIIKAIRPLMDFGLMEAKNFVEDLPQTVKEELDKDESEKLKKLLEEAGGTVDIK